MLDLLVLTAGNNDRFAIEGLLSRPQRLGIRPIAAQVRTRAGWRDADVMLRCHDFLRSQQRLASFGLVVFDREVCDRVDSREAIELEVEARLAASGWLNRSAAIVIDPELEVWFWSDSPHVEAALGWTTGRASLEAWLVRKGYLKPGQQKPRRPKEAVEDLLALSKTPRSSSIYRDLAERVSFQRCTDRAFVKLTGVLRQWFPAQGSAGENSEL